MLNKQKGNMYGFINKTRNFIGGECKYKCKYCYVNSIKNKFPNINERYSGEVRLLENELKKSEGEGNFIFVGSSCDMFADGIKKEWITKVLKHCKKYPNNKFLFQTKNPKRFSELRDELIMLDCILGTTIETNRLGKNYNAPPVNERAIEMEKLSFGRKMLTIEPIMDFDLDVMVNWIKDINPEFVNIGADSKGHNLPEPSWEKVMKLKEELEKFTKVNLKDNLMRLKK